MKWIPHRHHCYHRYGVEKCDVLQLVRGPMSHSCPEERVPYCHSQLVQPPLYPEMMIRHCMQNKLQFSIELSLCVNQTPSFIKTAKYLWYIYAIIKRPNWSIGVDKSCKSFT